MTDRYLRDLDPINNQHLHGITENAVFPDHLNEYEYKPRSLIDETLEIIDPTPNVYTMFIQFNEKFFWNKLDAVQVRWSKRMTTCAGTCSFHPRNRECVISLSLPLLKLRPRKDLVETLLHEMIHGFLFITNNNRDRDGHGPEFCKHMERINREAGTKITIYHDFHDEVRLYQQHWWKCDGPCQKRPPYFGIVRRSMNRAPGPSDFWWQNHQQNCGGKYIKIKEPENKQPTKGKRSSEVSKALPKQNTLDNFVQSTKTSSSSSSSFSNDSPKNKPGGIKTISGNTRSVGSKTVTVSKVGSGSLNTNGSEGIKKLGTSTNNVFGFGTGGPGSSSLTSSPPLAPKPSRNRVNSSGVLGGSNTGKSILLTRFLSPQPTKSNAEEIKPKTPPKQDQKNQFGNNAPECPICNKIIIDENINQHIDFCLISNDANSEEPAQKRPKITEESTHECPFCQQKFAASLIDIHVNDCLNLEVLDNNSQAERSQTSDTLKPRNSSAAPEDKRINCPKCDRRFTSDRINDHLDICLNEVGDLASNDSVVNLTNDAGDVTDLTLSPIRPVTGTEECITCGSRVRVREYNDHIEKCLKKHREKMERDLGAAAAVVVVVDDTDSRPGCSKSKKDRSTYECLVCNSRISNDIPLNEHLEICTSSTFGDMTLNTSGNNLLDEDPLNMEHRYSCPICNLMIVGKDMAEHVDWCVTRKK
ncbi:hypothetical protein G9C98_002658 [Cotesia typhae]|uniref:Protein with SprT-like domain at the N terminus n=1 Tax=Cotesia typhae TaxID=2053667 RepID=A0A8J5R278_9HYME|nr:hypothetical protein G9C98_002658 [Cotesia typhae]